MNETLNQLRALAREVHNYQEERDWSDTRLCKEIAHVGSSKTYKRILDPSDSLDELNCDNQLKNYKAAVEMIKLLRSRSRPAEIEYRDFRNIDSAKKAVRRALLEDEECVARLVIIEGNTGTGKDAVRRYLEAEHSEIIVSVEATELWRDSLAVPARAIYSALAITRRSDGESKGAAEPRYPAEVVSAIIEHLRKRKTILLINEAHHMGPRTLNMIKTLINQTPTVVIIECIPSLLTRLLSTSYEEAIQLVGNRLCERVYLSSPQSDEILRLFELRGITFASQEVSNTACRRVADEAANFGNWRFVVQVARELYATKTAVADKDVARVLNQVRSMRTRTSREVV